MANEKLQACYELHDLCNRLTSTLQHEFFEYQFEQLGMQSDAALLMDSITKLHDVVQANTLRLTSEVH